jgi:uncharacterized protein (TIGR01777 family)
MKVLIAGGTGFIGRNLARSFLEDNHQVWVLTRRQTGSMAGVRYINWDGRTTNGWGEIINEVDVVVNLSGRSLNSWPWTKQRKVQFHDSRVEPGQALSRAIEIASHRPSVFIQMSGVNHYGLKGETADEDSPPGDDYLARLTLAWEASSVPVEEMGVRRVVCRTAVVLARDAVLFWLLTFPMKLFLGGPLGSGRQALPWIHIDDEVGAIRFLIEHSSAHGPFNLIAPQATSNSDFMRTLAKTYHRPYWFPVPGFLLRMVLGEMSVLVTEGRFSEPRNLLKLGYRFHFPGLEDALQDLTGKK